MPNQFKCRPGECIECCKVSDTIPVTFGDLCIAWAYENSNPDAKEKKSIYDIAKEKCDGWTLMKIPGFFEQSTDNFFDQSVWEYWPVLKSKMPCVHLDEEKKICRAHGTSKYLTCRIMPELFLVPEARNSFEGNPDSIAFNIDCLDNCVLSAEEAERILELNRQFAHEVILIIKQEKGWKTKREALFNFKPEQLDERLKNLSDQYEKKAATDPNFYKAVLAEYLR